MNINTENKELRLQSYDMFFLLYLYFSPQTDDALSNLTLEFELQKQITNAAKKLSMDKSVSKYVRKQRRQSFHRAQAKVTKPQSFEISSSEIQT